MIWNYLKIAGRYLWKNRTYTLINVSGLAIGLACCLLIASYVADELNYDGFNRHKDHIFRLLSHDKSEGATTAKAAYVAGPELKAHFGEVLDYVRFYNFWNPNSIRYQDKVFSERKLYYTDPSAFKIFSFEFLEGNPETALKTPNSVVITQSMARKYFGKAEPMGKTLIVDNRFDFQVTGVIRDMPHNSHFHADFLANEQTQVNQFGDYKNSWLFNEFATYLLLSPKTSGVGFQKKIQPFINRQMRAKQETADNPEVANVQVLLQPLSRIHLYSANIADNLESQGNIAQALMLSVIALLILAIACFNYINLSMATSLKRIKELGLRKVIGASRRQIMLQYVSEALMLSGIALATALVLVNLCFPLFNTKMGTGLKGIFAAQPVALALIVGLTIVVAALSGSYLSYFAMRFPVAGVVVGKNRVIQKGNSLKKTLVVVQFSVTIILIISAFIIYRQLDYLQKSSLGFNKKQLLVVNMNDRKEVEKFQALKSKLLGFKHISGVSKASGVPPNPYHFSDVSVVGNSLHPEVEMKNFFVGYDFVDVLGLQITQGRNFSREHATDNTAAFILNQTAAKSLGIQHPIGTELHNNWGNKTGKVVGIVKDFHFKSFHEQIEPAILSLEDLDNIYSMVVKIAPDDIPATLSYIQAQWKAVNPDWPFVYHFVDDDFQALYQKDIRTGQAIGFFAGLALLISCFGLFGLVSFVTESRTKEIGIRKINGASFRDIFVLISGNFAILILIAFIVAIPIGYYLAQQWLHNFAYKTNVPWWFFAVAGLTTMAIATLTIGYKTTRAARKNPVEALRYE